MRVKIEVGQVWKCRSIPNDTFTISLIVSNYRGSGIDRAYYNDGQGHEMYFIDVINGEASLGSEWSLVPQQATIEAPPPTLAPAHEDMMTFFKSVPSGNCPCNILLAQCDFHGKSSERL